MNYKESYFVSVSAQMNATGIFTQNINVPFVPTHVIPRLIAYNEDHQVLVVKCDFVQGGVITLFSEKGAFKHKYAIPVTSPMNGNYTFRMTKVDGSISTGLVGGEFGMLLEFVR